jgi:hypothetical protein
MNSPQKVKLWYDLEADFFEVLFSDEPGYMKETDNDAVMERVNDKGKLIGFSVMGIKNLQSQKTLSASLSH